MPFANSETLTIASSSLNRPHAQFRSLMMIELGTAAERVVSVLNYDGMPITADNIFRQIKGKMGREI